MNPEKRYGPIPIDTDSELTEIAAESGMSLQELKEFLRVNRLGVFKPGSVPIAEEVLHEDKHHFIAGGDQPPDTVTGSNIQQKGTTISSP